METSRAEEARLDIDGMLAGIDEENPHRLLLARECWGRGQYDDAMTHLMSLTDAGDVSASKWFTTAIASQKLNRHEGAFAMLKLASDLMGDQGPDPQALIPLPDDDPDYRFALGYLLLGRGRLEEAHASLQESIRVRPDDPQTVYHLGLVFVEAGDQAAAREQFIRLSGLDDTLARRLYDRINF